MNERKRSGAARLRTSGFLVVALAGIVACSVETQQLTDSRLDSREAATTAVDDPSSTPMDKLPLIDPSAVDRPLAQLLEAPTALGDTTALHYRLPAPIDDQLKDSLVRVVGDADNPQILFNSDALAQIGTIPKSPGPDFFTLFGSLATDDLKRMDADQQKIASGAFGDATQTSIVFQGRTAIGQTSLVSTATSLPVGIPVPVSLCGVHPASSWAAWGQSLFITDPLVVQDPARTWDPCTGAGTQGGVWTFGHFINEMAIGSGTTASNFVLQWLSSWLNSYTVNGDTVPGRSAIFNQVIKPWAVASGATATLNTGTFGQFVTMTGSLNLNIAPFRLLAIVNRIDKGNTTAGAVSPYSGSTSGTPTDAGELRFIFNVVQPNPWGAGTQASCGSKLFTTIFEYGVPRNTCASVVDWAQKWSSLQTLGGFTPAYLAQLQTMTESVVKNGAAPSKGNKNALNQIRTNEIALSPHWELREFALGLDNGTGGTTPVNGLLRTHTVALTPDDAVFNAAGNATVDAFINGPVRASIAPSAVPPSCGPSPMYSMPLTFSSVNFRGANSLNPPGHWNGTTISVTDGQGVCARHHFSLNTCNGCHGEDSGTNGFGGSTSFTHINLASSIPVTLSKFLTGGGPGLVFNVPDSQFGSAVPAWSFADLNRRLQRLFDLAHCTACSSIPVIRGGVLNAMQDIAGVVPIDPGDPSPDFKVGAIRDISVLQKLIDVRASFADGALDQPVDFIRPIDSSPH